MSHAILVPHSLDQQCVCVGGGGGCTDCIEPDTLDQLLSTFAANSYARLYVCKNIENL